jgi:hypothetical protein
MPLTKVGAPLPNSSVKVSRHLPKTRSLHVRLLHLYGYIHPYNKSDGHNIAEKWQEIPKTVSVDNLSLQTMHPHIWLNYRTWFIASKLVLIMTIADILLSWHLTTINQSINQSILFDNLESHNYLYNICFSIYDWLVGLFMMFYATFNNISCGLFYWWWNWSTRGKPPTCHKSLTNFIT